MPGRRKTLEADKGEWQLPSKTIKGRLFNGDALRLRDELCADIRGVILRRSAGEDVNCGSRE